MLSAMGSASYKSSFETVPEPPRTEREISREIYEHEAEINKLVSKFCDHWSSVAPSIDYVVMFSDFDRLKLRLPPLVDVLEDLEEELRLVQLGEPDCMAIAKEGV